MAGPLISYYELWRRGSVSVGFWGYRQLSPFWGGSGQGAASTPPPLQLKARLPQQWTRAKTPPRIQDRPRFPHRGLMIDTGRHFQPLASIRSVIDSLPYAKINVLHWHMSDSQSFPFESKTYPRLWAGAYSDFEKYTQADIAAVVEYARARGVRVVVEFDMPGHAASWCKGYPRVCPSKDCPQPLNVADNATFDLIASVLKECTGGQV